jgi:hypothetical protein
VNPATMTPEQLAEHGIPAIVALRAKLEERTERLGHLAEAQYWYASGQEDAYRDALAILEAKGER